MDEKDMDVKLNHVEAAIACGGGSMTSERRRIAKDVLSGVRKADDVVDEIRRKYGTDRV